ncbi:MAG: hypothetical protein O2960_20545 [Verrucomicrobia bacterium]|nr:hypothetical protein [Verrucomicrobiota bacterium]
MNSVTAANSQSLSLIHNSTSQSKAANRPNETVNEVKASDEGLASRQPDAEQGEELSRMGILHRALIAAVDTNNSIARLFEPIS